MEVKVPLDLLDPLDQEDLREMKVSQFSFNSHRLNFQSRAKILSHPIFKSNLIGKKGPPGETGSPGLPGPPGESSGYDAAALAAMLGQGQTKGPDPLSSDQVSVP